MSHPLLVIDDDASTCELLAARLDPSKFTVLWSTQPEDAERLLRERAFDAVLTDVRMHQLDGIELCARIVEKHPGLPVVLMTAFGSIDTAVSAMRAGASDFLTKPLDAELVTSALERAIAHASLQRDVAARGRSITPEDLPEKVRDHQQRQSPGAGAEPSELVALDEIERRHILRVLEAMHGNKSRAAQVLGLDRKTLYRRLERYGAMANGEPSTSV